MVQDGAVADESSRLDIIEEIEENKHYPPDRDDFQRKLSRINSDINNRHAEVCKLLNKNGGVGSIAEARQRKEGIRKQREHLANEADSVKSRISGLRMELEDKKQIQLELEKDCRVRSREKLEGYLKAAEDRYRTKLLSHKEEVIIVNEINSLKRNRDKLEKLNEVKKERQEIENRVNDLRKRNYETYRRIETLKREQRAAGFERSQRNQDLTEIKKIVSELTEQRTLLIGEYNRERREYAEWIQGNRRKVLSSSGSYPASYPSVHRTKNSSVCVEDEELEPFFEQKRDCKRLIAYLEKLESQLNKSDGSDIKILANDSSDSADELPLGFQRLSIPPTKSTGSFKKSGYPGRKIKPTQPLSHEFEIYNLFGSIEIAVPKAYQDVSETLQHVRHRLSFFEQSTNVIDWDEEFKFLGNPVFSGTTSDFTGDSIYFDSNSESASFISSPNHQEYTGCQSPVQQMGTDEGISSTSSTAL